MVRGLGKFWRRFRFPMARWRFFIIGQIFFFQPEERADRIDTKFGTFLECTYSHARSEGLLLLFVLAPSLGLGVHKGLGARSDRDFFFFHSHW